MVQFCGQASTPLFHVTPLFLVNVPAVATPSTQFFVQLEAVFAVAKQVIPDNELQALNISSYELAESVVARKIGESVKALQLMNIL